MTNSQKKLLTFYRHGLEKISSWDKVPVSDKSLIRDARVPARFAELRVTSGSTGEPLYVFYSTEALKSFIKRAVISLKKSGVTSSDVVLNLFAYGNYVPGSMYEKACQAEGISIMPLGAPNTYSKDKVLEAIIKVKPNVWLSVPSYAIALANLLVEKKATKSLPKKVILAGERLLDSHIETFEKYGIEVINHFGLTECPAIGVSKKGNPKALEIINVGIHTESMVDEKGDHYFVVTDLHNFATPVIRYKTGDIIEKIQKNKNGTLAEFSIVGRGDDLIKIQGVLLSRSKIIEILSNFTDRFVVNILTKEGRDFVEIVLHKTCEKHKTVIEEQVAFLKKRELIFQEEITIPTTTSFKNKYIVDLRQ